MDSKNMPHVAESEISLAVTFANEICTNGWIKMINKQLHWFNGFYYECVDRKALEVRVLNWIIATHRQNYSARIAKECAYILTYRQYAEEKPAEDSGYLCFYNGIIHLPSEQTFGTEGFPYWNNPVTYRILAQVPLFPIYNRTTSTPYMDAFLKDISNNDCLIVKRIWEMVGYLLSPDVKAKVLFLLQGASDSGKSVLGKLISSFFEDSRIRYLDIDQLGKRNATSALMNTCLNVSMDLPNKELSPLAVRNLKLMTGNDDVEVEFRPGIYSKYYGRCKFLFATNHPIKLKGMDKGFTSRIICIPFKNAIPKERQNRELLEHLLLEKDAIVIKALQAYSVLTRNNYTFSGTGECEFDPVVRYLPTDAENRNDIVCEFVEKNCDLVPVTTQGNGIYTETLYRVYLRFCEENCYTPINTVQGFAQSLMRNYKDSLIKTRWREGNENKNGFKGIILHPMEFDI